MINFSSLETGLLEPTATYSQRAWGWYDATGEHGIGLLTLELRYTDGFLAESTYHVHELDPVPGLLGRRFALRRAGADRVYEVTLGAMPGCTCPGGQFRAKHASICKHLDAMKVIEARGLLGDPLGLLAEPPSGLWFHDEPGEPTTAELSPQLETAR